MDDKGLSQFGRRVQFLKVDCCVLFLPSVSAFIGNVMVIAVDIAVSAVDIVLHQ